MHRYFAVGVCALVAIAFSTAALAERRVEVQTQPGLQAQAQLITDAHGITHVAAVNETDLYFLQGWVHARDRFFQMDQNRRIANGTLAELLGPAALGSDVQLRTIGLRRAAQRSLAALSLATRSSIAAYTRGVNAWLAANPLPPEYGALELTRAEPWTDADSVVVAKLIAFSCRSTRHRCRPSRCSPTSRPGEALGFDGQALFAEDLNRAAPFDSAATVPDASVPRAHAGHRPGRHEHRDIDPKALEQAHDGATSCATFRCSSAFATATGATARTCGR